MNIREANATNALIRAYLDGNVHDPDAAMVEVQFLASRVNKALLTGITPEEVAQRWPNRLRPQTTSTLRPAEPANLDDDDDELECPRCHKPLAWAHPLRAWMCGTCGDEFPYRQHPHSFCGSDSDRQSVGQPGHCELCCSVGHVRAHSDYGCADVGCNAHHGPEVTA
ncbi:hypothetical protein [Actinophytocola sp.]|uniref:hypothetical protein n=1 Tax=Actinophytocola sp. TaxID=1872138 RepID=UPI002D5E94BF|nr:hypothetical protein [Actinophytocola sp.]HYQ69045.1 hypothetical protein [Actinophytocola sp.]